MFVAINFDVEFMRRNSISTLIPARFGCSNDVTANKEIKKERLRVIGIERNKIEN